MGARSLLAEERIGLQKINRKSSLKIFLSTVSLLLIGFFSFDAVYLIAPGSLHGNYAFSCNWHAWGLTAQPMTLTMTNGSVGPYDPKAPSPPPQVVQWARYVQIGPIFILHD